MSLFVFFILAVAIAWLWRRVDALEHEVASLRRPAATSAVAIEPAIVAMPAKAATPEDEPAYSKNIRGWSLAWRPSFDFEDVFGRLLPIWAGGVTLAVAGFFLVRWSIDAGLLTPPVRVVLAGLFGIALLGGAETAYRWRDRVADPRVAQALAGAGLATLYAAFYLAGTAYGLIGSTFAFLGLAAVTGLAIALSYRFGLPSAVLGLVGGFAAPALVGSEQANLPLLTLYLGLVTAGLALTGRRQDRSWLGIAALAGGLGWGALLIGGARVQAADVVVLGVYVVLLGAIVPALAGGGARPHWMVRVGAAILAALQLAVLVQQGGFGALEWSLYLLLGTALAWFGWRQPAMREGNAVAATVGVALLFVWPGPAPSSFAIVCAALAAIFAGVPLAQLMRGHGRTIDVAQVGGVALGIAFAALWHFGTLLPDRPEPLMALGLLVVAALPAAAIALAPRSTEEQPKVHVAVEAIAALVGFGAIAQVLPRDALAWTAAILAMALAWRTSRWPGAVATLAVLAAVWAIAPLFAWLDAGALALVGTPMRTADLPVFREVLLFVLPTVVGAAASSGLSGVATSPRRLVRVAAITLAAIAAHIVYRHAFASLASDDFIATGVIERAVWQSILLAAAGLAWTRGWHKVAIGLSTASLAHFAWFSLALHNPLWSAQAVGGVPVGNLLAPAYAIGLAAVLALRRWLAGSRPVIRWALDAATMAIIAVFALSELRQAHAGSLLDATPVGQGEDLMRSLIGIVLAIGFLLMGRAPNPDRFWRAKLAPGQPRADGHRGAQGVPGRRCRPAGARAHCFLHGVGVQPDRYRLVLCPPVGLGCRR